MGMARIKFMTLSHSGFDTMSRKLKSKNTQYSIRKIIIKMQKLKFLLLKLLTFEIYKFTKKNG